MKSTTFEIGTILRYDNGSTALMEVTTIRENHGGEHTRYWGIQCMGGYIGRYDFQVYEASQEDLKTWEETKNWRKDTVRREVSEDSL
jgi:hypothetical protein